SPAFHAIQFLMGNLDASYLTRLRAFGGLQSYPSRTKDPDPVDFSTGSVGLGAVAPMFAALAYHYLRLHFRESIASQPERRFVALVGDAELDEGNVWEAILEEGLGELGNVTMIVDLNRQSLDPVVPGIRIRRVEGMFAAAGWHAIEAKYGRLLQERFALPGGDALRERIDDMENEDYQILIRRPGPELRERLLEGAAADRRDDLARNVRDVPDDDLPRLIGDLGGHDQGELARAFREADEETARPTVIFAYTIKGWRLPFAGDSLNHSAHLVADQVDQLGRDLGIDPDDVWAGFAPGSPEANLATRRRT